MMNKNNYLETENLTKLMLRYALPCIISLLVGALYNIVDQIFIANASYLGSYGNAANSVVFPLTIVALAIATMVGDGACAFISLSLGANKKDDAAQALGVSVVTTLVASILITLIYLLFSEEIILLFGGGINEETFTMAKEYFFWISVGIPFYMFGQAMNPIIRADGSPKFAMFTLILGSLLNVILDPLFIYPLKLGMAGAAIATILGQIAAALLALYYLFNMQSILLRRESFRIDFALLKRILMLGMTSFLSQISLVFSMAAVNNMARQYGALDPIFGIEQYAQIPTAVIGIVMKFFQIIISIAIGISAGCIPLVSYNMGAGNKERVKGLLKRILIGEFVIGLGATLIFELFPLQLINIFGAANESKYYTDFALKCIRLFLCMTSLACINKGTFIYLQALGKAWSSTLLSLLREIILGVGLTLLLPYFFGLDGLLYFMAIADIITFIISIIVIKLCIKSLNKEVEDQKLKFA